MKTPCPFLANKTCSIYEIRPEGCRQFPNTVFGMLTQDCEALTRFKKQCAALSTGRTAKRTYHSTKEPIKETKIDPKRYQDCVAKLRKAGVTEDELVMFRALNREEESPLKR
jgi:Fe-S-cluster containining protein